MFSNRATMKILLPILFSTFHVLTEGSFFDDLHKEPEIRINPLVREPVEHWVEQNIDHFDTTDLRKWEMRYFSNDQYFKEGGPIIIQVGAEWKIKPAGLEGGIVVGLAERLNGYMFYTEHRYYGHSLPIEGNNADDLKYLTIEQALADMAFFIQYIKKSVKGLEHSKVLLLGCSYGGTMSTYARIKYPHLVDVAYASSSPLKASRGVPEYINHVELVWRQASEECAEDIFKGFQELKNAMETMSGRERVQKAYRLCKPAPVDPVLQTEFYRIAIKPFLLAQYNNLDFHREKCDKLKNLPGSPMEKIAQMVSKSLECIDILYPKGNAWTYQCCRENGYAEDTTNSTIFANVLPKESLEQMCQSRFGYRFNDSSIQNGIDRTNLDFGADRPKTSHVVSVQGAMDPWNRLGYFGNLSDTVIGISIDDGIHCEEFKLENDRPAVSQAQKMVYELISQWLQDE